MAERSSPFNPITGPRSTTFKALKPIEGIVIVYTFHDSNYLGPAGPTGFVNSIISGRRCKAARNNAQT